MTILSPTFVSPSFSASSAAALPRPDGATDYRLQTIRCTLDHQTGQNKTSINHWETFPAPSSSHKPACSCRLLSAEFKLIKSFHREIRGFLSSGFEKHVLDALCTGQLPPVGSL